jgi:hypothetical protein
MPIHVINEGTGLLHPGEMDTSLVLPATSGKGFEIDVENPSFGWRDILGEINVRGAGAADPTFAIYGATNFYQFQFSATVLKEVFIVYHVPHDYLPGSDIYFHAHWSNAAASPSVGAVVWGFEYTWAKGFDQAPFGASATVTATQTCSAQRYRHNIAETAAVTIAGLEVDSLVMVRVFRDATNVADTCADAVFLHMSDIHYQTTNIGTKNKAPNFYG